MRDLAKGKIAEDSLRMLWIGHLPTAVRAVLAVTKVELDGLAVIADKIVETTQSVEVAEVQVARTSSADLAAQVAKLTLEVQELRRGRTEHRGPYRQQRHGTPRPRYPDRAKSVSKGRSRKSPDWLCFYHYKYGNKANKCVEPCNWEKRSKQQEN